MTKRENGFTLIELLATVIILSILMTIAVTGYSAYVRSSNKTYYENLANTTKDTIIDFFADNRNYLPKQVGDTRQISVEDLVLQNYLEQIVDVKNLPCTGNGTVLKKGANSYDYKVCIQCPSYEGKIGDGCD